MWQMLLLINCAVNQVTGIRPIETKMYTVSVVQIAYLGFPWTSLMLNSCCRFAIFGIDCMVFYILVLDKGAI